jgi:hypothetical protein
MNATTIINDVRNDEGDAFIQQMAAAPAKFDKFNRITCVYSGTKIPQGTTYYYSKATGAMCEAVHSAALAAVGGRND